MGSHGGSEHNISPDHRHQCIFDRRRPGRHQRQQLERARKPPPWVQQLRRLRQPVRSVAAERHAHDSGSSSNDEQLHRHRDDQQPLRAGTLRWRPGVCRGRWNRFRRLQRIQRNAPNSRVHPSDVDGVLYHYHVSRRYRQHYGPDRYPQDEGYAQLDQHLSHQSKHRRPARPARLHPDRAGGGQLAARGLGARRRNVQSGTLRGADGGARERPDDTGHLVRALLRHLRAAQGRLRVHEGACLADLSGGVDGSRNPDEVE
uniref:Uncharacterized protein n=1 Tax=Anopheles atroparvus TaxID=41427 RepID=A0AAG5CVQ1_ANOAO